MHTRDSHISRGLAAVAILALAFTACSNGNSTGPSTNTLTYDQVQRL